MSKETDTFIRITNKDIYYEIKGLRTLVEQHKELNEKQHSILSQKQDLTNGKVKLTRWVATTALSLSIVAITIRFF